MGTEWFRRFDPLPGRPRHVAGAPRLFCFPHAGGAASAFIPLARALKPALDALVVQYPGRQDRRREEPIDDIGRLADALTDEVRRHGEGPYAFFGHSMGAVLAYEVSRRLTAEHGPAALILSGRGAPTPEPSRHDRLRTDDDIVQAVRALGGTTPQVLQDPELREMVMPALRADYRAIGSYAWRPGPSPAAPTTVLIGDSDPVATVEQAERWREFTSGRTTTHVFAGGHFFLDAHLARVAGTVTAAVAAGLAPASGAVTTPG